MSTLQRYTWWWYCSMWYGYFDIFNNYTFDVLVLTITA